MSSRNTDLADAIVELLNSPGSPGFSQEFEAVRTLLPQKSFESLEDLTVLVAPISDTPSPGTRARKRHEMVVNIAVAKRILPTTDPTDSALSEEADNLIELAEEVVDYFDIGQQIDGRDLRAVDHNPLFDEQSLKDRRAIFSLITLTFETYI